MMFRKGRSSKKHLLAFTMPFGIVLLIACGNTLPQAELSPGLQPPRSSSSPTESLPSTVVPTALPEDPSPTTVSEVGTPAPGATESGVNSAPPHYTVLLTKAQQNGSVRIIIGLQVPFVPEGNLPDEAAVTAQRKAIADAQDALLRRLAGHNTQNVITFEYAPFIAMDVDSAALSQLIVDPEVSSIEEDGLSSPSLSGPGQ